MLPPSYHTHHRLVRIGPAAERRPTTFGMSLAQSLMADSELEFLFYRRKISEMQQGPAPSLPRALKSKRLKRQAHLTEKNRQLHPLRIGFLLFFFFPTYHMKQIVGPTYFKCCYKQRSSVPDYSEGNSSVSLCPVSAENSDTGQPGRGNGDHLPAPPLPGCAASGQYLNLKAPLSLSIKPEK